MTRLTKQPKNQEIFYVDSTAAQCSENGCTGEAIDRLARFENAYEDVIAGQEAVLNELDRLREEGKTKTVRFRELLGNKMMNNMMISLFQRHGLK